MKATGTIRRIDDLGRVVIPKEIRRTMRLTEGDPLELFIEDGGLMLKKYSPIDKIQEIAEKYIKMLKKEFSGVAEFCITDTDYLLAATGDGEIKRLVDSNLDPLFIDELRKRSAFLNVMKFMEKSDVKSQIVYPIIYEGELYGSLIVHSVKEFDLDKMGFACRTMVNFIQGELLY